jgi:replicative DNA helicase
MTSNQTSQKSNLRVPPQNIESEKALLGSIMLKPDILNEITTIISPESFYAEKHRMIYKTIFELFGKNEPIDILSVSSRMKEKKQLEQIGGRSYLAELVNLVPSAGNAKHYAGLVQKTGMMRALINAADYISGLGYDEEHDVDEMLDKAEKKIYEVTESPTLHKFTEIKDSLGEAWERLRQYALWFPKV